MVRTHIIMPVKDSLKTAEESIRAVVASGHTLTVYDDNSTAETAKRLDELSDELGIRVIHVVEQTSHPSPNYRWVLQMAQKDAMMLDAALVIVESDVIVGPDTIDRLSAAVEPGVGMVASVTHNARGRINFPYEYARVLHKDGPCNKRLSFCCTLLTPQLLKAYSFEMLDPEKNWYDVYISHLSQKVGLLNILQISNPVLHKPHSSRPWKKLKYTRPILYYWQKMVLKRDRI